MGFWGRIGFWRHGLLKRQIGPREEGTAGQELGGKGCCKKDAILLADWAANRAYKNLLIEKSILLTEFIYYN